MQIFIPSNEQQGSESGHHYTALKDELTDLFGGVTIYARAPVKGIWKAAPDTIQTDNMVIYEVMTQKLSLTYWNALKSRLEDNFCQEEILMRYFSVSVVK